MQAITVPIQTPVSDEVKEYLFTKLTEAISEYSVVEGFSQQIPGQMNRIQEIIRIHNPSSIMEIGFNAGHSALLFLCCTSPSVHVVSFDLGYYGYVFAAKRFIDEYFPGRHTLITGDSTQTIPNYEEHIMYRDPVPPSEFDLLFIDGGHDGDVPLNDCINSMRLASSKNVVMVDDINRIKPRQTSWNMKPTYAWELMFHAGLVTEDGFDDYYIPNYEIDLAGRGMAWGRYIPPMAAEWKEESEVGEKYRRDIAMRTHQLFYKHMNKDQMVSKINEMYNSRSLEHLNALTTMYLDYFADLDVTATQHVRFYQAFANFHYDKETSLGQFEKIIDDPAMDENLRFYSMCNLGTLYKRDSNPIPKIIHLLFFGETDFHNYHHRCVHSMLQYMPDYAVRIYNVIPPVGNKYWDDIVSNKNVSVIPVMVPEYFDGFQLHHFQYKADVVRLEVLYEFGGVYLDLDMLITRNFEEVFSSGHELYLSKEKNDRDCLINAFMAAKPKNGFLRLWLDAFKSGLRMNIWAHHIRDTNKQLLDKNPHYMYKYHITLLEGDTFFPFHWQDRWRFEASENDTVAAHYEFPDKSYGTHLWETILGDVMLRNRFLRYEKARLNVYKNGAFCEDDDEVKLVIQEEDDIKAKAAAAAATTKPSSAPELSNVVAECPDASFLRSPQFAEKVVVLCLAERPDKSEYVSTHLSDCGLPHVLMMNNLHTNPVVGCFRSHIKAIQYAKDNNFGSVLILEDDVVLRPHIKDLQHISLPNEWDILYFGGVLTKYAGSDESGKWVKGSIWCNHAYLVKNHMYDIILSEYLGCDDIEHLENMNIDYFYTEIIQKKYKCWLAVDQYIIQKEGYSDITKGNKWGDGFDWSTFSVKYIPK